MRILELIFLVVGLDSIVFEGRSKVLGKVVQVL